MICVLLTLLIIVGRGESTVELINVGNDGETLAENKHDNDTKEDFGLLVVVI